jgi:hypothetical protein
VDLLGGAWSHVLEWPYRCRSYTKWSRFRRSS